MNIVHPKDVQNATLFLHAVVAILNFGHGVPTEMAGTGRKPTAAQQTCFGTIGFRIMEFAGRLQSDAPSDFSSEAAWQAYEDRGSAPRLDLLADLVDYPAVAGTCDPLLVIPPDIGKLLSDINFMFPAPPEGLNRFSGFYAGDRDEYVKLTANLLKIGKLTLRHEVKGGGTVFPVEKPGGTRQREVWHGTRVSQACAPPFPPRLLASPSAFAGIELADGHCLHASKRDGRCFFDQLVLPPTLSEFMGRPAVTADELLRHGVLASEHVTCPPPRAGRDLQPTDRQLGRFECHDHAHHVLHHDGLQSADPQLGCLERHDHEPHVREQGIQSADRRLGRLAAESDGRMKIWDIERSGVSGETRPSSSELWPCSKVWGMGFAWSSYVAQETLLGVCARAGLHNRLALAVGHPVPASEQVFFSLATDDVMIFSQQGPGHTLAAAKRLDSAMADAGIVKHEAKDINDLTDVTCVGVDLVGGRWWWPPVAKMWQLLLGTVGLCTSRRGSSAALRAFHGLIQWFDLLQRGKFAFYDSIYRESEAWSDWTVRDLPSDVLR